MELKNHVEAAVVAAKGQTLLAAHLGVSQQAISKWLRRGWVSPTRAQEIEALYGIPRKKLMNPKLVALLQDPADDFEA
ncbi:helix-turn-helix domain-containing protein [Alcaligenaceae bacterium]|nr:helix-turn-helix domain-containing protein [Alcaligenaceae bacterium]